MSKTFSHMMFAYHRATDEFETNLHDIDGFEFETIGGDYYDTSIEFYGVPPEARLSEAAQRFIWKAGFIRCWLNHTDGWETYYVWDDGPDLREHQGFRISEGYRTLKRHKAG